MKHHHYPHIHNYSSQNLIQLLTWATFLEPNMSFAVFKHHTHTQNAENLIIRCGKICQSHVSQSGIIKPSVNFPAYMRIVLVCVGVFWEPICEMSSNSVIFIFNHTCHFLELRTRSHLFMVLYHINTPLNYMIFIYFNQHSQFYSVLSRIVKILHINSKNKIKWNNFNLILNLDSFWIFRLNSGKNVPVSFHMFRFALEKPLNQIESYSI